MSGGAQGSECDELWTCILLGVHWRLGEGKAGVPVMQEGGWSESYFTFEGIGDVPHRPSGHQLQLSISCVYL